MALSHVLLSAAMLLPAADPLHHHADRHAHAGPLSPAPAGPTGHLLHRHHAAPLGHAVHSGHIGPLRHLHGGHGLLGHGARAVELYDPVVFDGVLTGIEAGQHPAPTVVLWEAMRAAGDPTGRIYSTDFPGFWTPVAYGPLMAEVRLDVVGIAGATEFVLLLLDGEPIDPNRYAASAESVMLDGEFFQTAYRYSLPCPPPGKHILQARYKIGGLWSRLSAPLHFEVRLPAPPQIVAVSEDGGHPTPLVRGHTVSITGPSLKFQLAHVNHNATLVAYLNGEPTPALKAESSCCRSVQLQGRIPPGTHTLTVRTVHTQGTCSITSEPSNEVVFHYYDEDVYLLRPGRNYGNRPARAPDSRKPGQAGNPPSEAAAPGQHGFQVPPITSPANAAAGASATNVFRHAAFPVHAEAAVTGYGLAPVTFVALLARDYPAEARQSLQTAVSFAAATADAAAEADKAAGDAAGQALLATQAAREAGAARDAAITARQQAASKHAEAIRAANEAKDCLAPPAGDARRRANDERQLAEQMLNRAVAAADRAAAHAVSAAEYARKARETSAAAEGARAAAKASAAGADKALEEARIIFPRIQEYVTAGKPADADAALTSLNSRLSAIEAARNEAVRQRDLAQHAARAATNYRQATQTAKAGAGTERGHAEQARQDAVGIAARAIQAAVAAREADARALLDDAAKSSSQAVDAAKQAASWADLHAQAAEQASTDTSLKLEAVIGFRTDAEPLYAKLKLAGDAAARHGATAAPARDASNACQRAETAWRNIIEAAGQLETDFTAAKKHAADARAHADAAAAASAAAAAAGKQAEQAGKEAESHFNRIRSLRDADDLSGINAARSQLQIQHRAAREQQFAAQQQRDAAEQHARAGAAHRHAADGIRDKAETARITAVNARREIVLAADQTDKAAAAASRAALQAATAPAPAATPMQSASQQAAAAARRASLALDVTAAARVQAQQDQAAAAEQASAADQMSQTLKVVEQRAHRSASEAQRAAEEALLHAKTLAQRGDSADARVAQRRAEDAATARDMAVRRAGQAADEYQKLLYHVNDAIRADGDAAIHAQQAEEAAVVVAEAEAQTRLASDDVASYANSPRRAAASARDAERRADAAENAAATVVLHATLANMAAQQAAAAYQQAVAAGHRLREHVAAAESLAADAQEHARVAGLTEQIEAETREARDLALAESTHRRLEERRAAAAQHSETKPADVRLAEFDAAAAGTLAGYEEAKAEASWREAEARIRVAEAQARAQRAEAVTGPSSPFYFAAPAHFPIRGFGAGGEVIERPGAVIYEDMVFSFDPDGNYNLRFSILVPEVPTTLHLQLHLQPYTDGPWHTITLAPLHFRPEESRGGRTEPRLIQNHVVQGRSEILHRCYAEVGQQGTIRRTGSARFGYGFDAMRQAQSLSY